MTSLWAGTSVTRGALHPHKMQSIAQSMSHSKDSLKYDICHMRLMSVYGTCARFGSRVFRYRSKQPEDHRPKTL